MKDTKEAFEKIRGSHTCKGWFDKGVAEGIKISLEMLREMPVIVEGKFITPKMAADIIEEKIK